jgi:hypothetical protein
MHCLVATTSSKRSIVHEGQTCWKRAKIPIFESGLRWKIAEHGLHDLQADEPATDVYGGFVAKYGFSP